MTQFYPLHLASICRDTPHSVVLSLVPDQEHRDLFRHAPGQHLTLRAWLHGEEVRRCYSLCGAPEATVLELGIKRVPGGRFSEWANTQLREGDVIEALPPAGQFGLRIAPGAARHYAGFAGGSGITPILSILRAVLRQERDSRFTLVYCNRNLASMQFRERLAELKDRYPSRLSLIYLFSEDEQGLALLNGRLDRARCQRLLSTLLPAAGIDCAYVCGPAGMMDAVREALLESGMPDERIRREYFAGAAGASLRGESQALDAGAVQVTVLMDGLRHQLELAAPMANLLEGLLQSGVSPRYSCKAGVCATCRCRVLAGQVAMDAPHALAPEEVAAGYALACRSKPLSPALTLSFE